MAGGRQFRRDAFSLGLEAPLVIAMRCHRMRMAVLTGSTRDCAEMSRMVTEQMAATAQSVAAANFAAVKAVMTARALRHGPRRLRSRDKTLWQARAPACGQKRLTGGSAWSNFSKSAKRFSSAIA